MLVIDIGLFVRADLAGIRMVGPKGLAAAAGSISTAGSVRICPTFVTLVTIYLVLW